MTVAILPGFLLYSTLIQLALKLHERKVLFLHLLVCYLYIQSTQSSVQVREEFRLKVAVDKRVWFLRAANDQREPIVLEVGTTDTLDSTDGDGSL